VEERRREEMKARGKRKDQREEKRKDEEKKKINGPSECPGPSFVVQGPIPPLVPVCLRTPKQRAEEPKSRTNGQAKEWRNLQVAIKLRPGKLVSG
jgi:hypothetical protein